MSQIARATGLGRESLYKALSPEGNPEFASGDEGGPGTRASKLVAESEHI